ncbi:MAG: neuromedin [Gemmatimonadetes bacterium]|nr:neuromedin [Gemmatimonadota bacterium]
MIPVTLNKDWNLITRTIFPLIWQPETSPLQDGTFGLGDTQFSAFLSPSDASSGWVWGVGAIAQLPTHTDSDLGNENWGLGPTAVVLRLEKGSPWVYGMLINNIWSLGNSDDPSYNNGLIQPFLNYNFKGGTYLTSAPIMTVNWDAESDDQWTIPVGGGIGLPPRAAAGECPAQRLLQRRHAGLRRRLATARPGAADVPQVMAVRTLPVCAV